MLQKGLLTNNAYISGFSLAEILVTLAILAMLYAIALPVFQEIANDLEARHIHQSLYALIEIAQTAADDSLLPIGLCGSLDQLTCDDHWSAGQLLFIDYRHNGLLEDQSAILTASKLLMHAHQLYWQGFPVQKHYMLFTPMANPDKKVGNSTFWLCTTHDQQIKWAIFISQTGRIRTVYPDADGQIIDSRHRSLSCSG